MTGICRTVIFTALAGAALVLPRVSNAQATDDDKQFLAKASQGGVNEIKLSQLAEQKATNPQVKAFAHKMVTEHTMMAKSMEPYATAWGISAPTDMDDSHKSDYEKLNGLSGKDFDKQYIDDMVSDHNDAESLFKTEIKDTKDMKFRKTVENGYSHVVAHDNIAKNLKKQM